MKTMNQIIGDNLKRIRELSGFTQEQTAKSVGIERSAYSNYEGGTREVPYDVWNGFQIYSAVSLSSYLRIIFKRTMRFWPLPLESPIWRMMT